MVDRGGLVVGHPPGGPAGRRRASCPVPWSSSATCSSGASIPRATTGSPRSPTTTSGRRGVLRGLRLQPGGGVPGGPRFPLGRRTSTAGSWPGGGGRAGGTGRRPSVRPVLVALHAHPDDESIFTGGTIVTAVEAGWRVVLVVATDGDRAARSPGHDLAGHRAPRSGPPPPSSGSSGWSSSASATPATNGVAGAGRRPGPRLGRGRLAAAHLDGGRRRAAGSWWRRGRPRSPATTTTASTGTSTTSRSTRSPSAAWSVPRASSTRPPSTGPAAAASDRAGRPAAWMVPVAVGAGRQLGVDDGPDLVRGRHRAPRPKLAAVAAHSSQVLEAPTFMGLPAGAFHHLLGTEWFRVARTVGAFPRPGGAERDDTAGAPTGPFVGLLTPSHPTEGAGRLEPGPGAVRCPPTTRRS